jgi:hypothetical protein
MTTTVKRMEELAKFKEFLGLAAEEYSEVQLRQLQREMMGMADLLLDIYLYKRSRIGENTSPKNFDNPESPS